MPRPHTVCGAVRIPGSLTVLDGACIAAAAGTHAAPSARRMTAMLEPEVLVFSTDAGIRHEVGAAVARRPGAHAVYAGPEAEDAPVVDRSRIVVIDDEGRTDAVDLLRRLTTRGQDASVVYLAADHSPALEAEVRRAGASFYAVKSTRDGDLTRVIEVLLARSRA